MSRILDRTASNYFSLWQHNTAYVEILQKRLNLTALRISICFHLILDLYQICVEHWTCEDVYSF